MLIEDCVIPDFIAVVQMEYSSDLLRDGYVHIMPVSNLSKLGSGCIDRNHSVYNFRQRLIFTLNRYKRKIYLTITHDINSKYILL